MPSGKSFKSSLKWNLALIVGSRATRNYKHVSDVDIVLKGVAVNYNTGLSISSVLNKETLMPYRFDVVNYNTIQNQDLKSHIDRVGKLIYERVTTSVLQDPKEEYYSKTENQKTKGKNSE
mgnify:CR=1 FL=1